MADDEMKRKLLKMAEGQTARRFIGNSLQVYAALCGAMLGGWFWKGPAVGAHA